MFFVLFYVGSFYILLILCVDIINYSKWTKPKLAKWTKKKLSLILCKQFVYITGLAFIFPVLRIFLENNLLYVDILGKFCFYVYNTTFGLPRLCLYKKLNATFCSTIKNLCCSNYGVSTLSIFSPGISHHARRVLIDD